MDVNEEDDKCIDMSQIIAKVISQDTLRAWDNLQFRQLQQLGGLLVCVEEKILRMKEDPNVPSSVLAENKELRDAVAKLGPNQSYIEMLSNYKCICETICDIQYKQKNFYAALCMQIFLSSKINRTKRQLNTSLKKKMVSGRSLELAEEAKGKQVRSLSENFPAMTKRIRLDPSSFIDPQFTGKDGNKFDWVRAKDLIPEVILIIHVARITKLLFLKMKSAAMFSTSSIIANSSV